MEATNNSTLVAIAEAVICRDVNLLNGTDQCHFVLTQPDCHSDIGYVNYLSFMYCSFGSDSSMKAVAFAVMWLLVLFVGLGVTANDFLCPALFVISKNLRLSQNVAGVTLLAFGNGSPDIFSALAGIRQGKIELVIGGLVGAGIFVTTVVAGSIFLTKSFKMMKRPFLRDVSFYLVAASWAFYLFYSGSIQLFHAVGFMALYLLYIVVVVVSRIIHQKHAPQAKTEKAKEAEAHGSEVKDVESVETTTTTFEGEDPEDDPEAVGVVLKSFYYYNNGFQWDEKNNTVPDDFEPPTEIFIIPDPTPDPGCSSHQISRSESVKKESLKEGLHNLPAGEHNEVKLLLEKISPVDLEAWGEKTWTNHAVELAKSPVLFALTLTTPVVDYRSKMNNWCRSLTLIQCITGPLFIIFGTGNGTMILGGSVPLAVVVTVIGLLGAVAIYFTSVNTEAPRYHAVFAYIGFAVSVVWIYIISIEIVVLLQAVGIVFNLSDTLIGLTILAWGNCLLDFMANVGVARKGFPRMGIAACFGSPFLTLLMGVGVPCAIQLFGDLNLPGIMLNFTPLVVVLFATLGISLLSTSISMVATKFVVQRPFGVYLIALYLTFLVTAILVELGVV